MTPACHSANDRRSARQRSWPGASQRRSRFRRCDKSRHYEGCRSLLPDAQKADELDHPHRESVSLDDATCRRSTVCTAAAACHTGNASNMGSGKISGSALSCSRPGQHASIRRHAQGSSLQVVSGGIRSPPADPATDTSTATSCVQGWSKPQTHTNGPVIATMRSHKHDGPITAHHVCETLRRTATGRATSRRASALNASAAYVF
jgi:hypothetical protein